MAKNAEFLHAAAVENEEEELIETRAESVGTRSRQEPNYRILGPDCNLASCKERSRGRRKIVHRAWC